MKKKMTKTALTLFSMMLSANAYAADTWTITQTTTGNTGNVTLEQKGTVASSDSHQAMNAVYGVTKVAAGSQTVTMGSHNLTLNQLGNLTTAVQASNYVEAATVGDTTAFTQNFNSTATAGTTDSASLRQLADLTGGSGDTQAINAAKATTITKLQQNVTVSGELDLKQQTTTTTNQQVVNGGQADTITDLKQVITNSGHNLVLEQSGGTSTNTQAGNAAIGKTITLLDQDVTAKQIDLKQNAAAGSNTQAANYAFADTTGAATMTQDATADVYALTQSENTAGANLQAVNAVKSTAPITTSLTQQIVVTTAGAKTFNMTQTNGGSNSMMAGNLLTSTKPVTKVTQNFTNSNAIVTLSQQKQGNGVQALNLIDVKTLGAQLTEGIQSIDAASLTMNQGTTTKVSGSIQAGNAVLTGTGTLDGKTTQTATADFILTQDNAGGSVQTVNYLGGFAPAA